MSKLIALLLVLTLHGPSAAYAQGDGAGRDLFDRLESEGQERGRGLLAEEVAAILFAKGPRTTSSLLVFLESTQGLKPTSKDWAKRLERALDEVPRLAVSMLRSPSLEDGDAVRVASVSLEILGRRGEQDRGRAQLEEIFKGLRHRAGAKSLGPAVRRATHKIAQRGTLDEARLFTLVRASKPDLSAHVLDGAAKGLLGDALASCLLRGTGLDRTILNQLHRAVQLGATVRMSHVQSKVVPFLKSPVDFERSEAALILGLIGHRDQIEALIGALGDSSSLVRTSSLRALHRLTGMTIAGSQHRWQHWHAAQRAWWIDGGEALVTSLRSVPRTRLVEALASVASKRLYRKEIGSQLVTLLDGSPPDEICAVLAALGSLRDRDFVPHITRLCSHTSPAVRACAAEAIEGIGKQTSR